MAYDLVWSSEADKDFKAIIFYLKQNWSHQSADKFVLQAYRRLEKLAVMPSIARATTQQAIYMYKLDKKNVVFFTIEEKYLVLLSIYPYKRDITKSKYF